MNPPGVLRIQAHDVFSAHAAETLNDRFKGYRRRHVKIADYPTLERDVREWLYWLGLVDAAGFLSVLGHFMLRRASGVLNGNTIRRSELPAGMEEVALAAGVAEIKSENYLLTTRSLFEVLMEGFPDRPGIEHEYPLPDLSDL